MVMKAAKHDVWSETSLVRVRQAAQLEVFGPHDADGFEGLGLAKALADHLEGAPSECG